MVAGGTWNPPWPRPPSIVRLLTPGQPSISRSTSASSSSSISRLLALLESWINTDRPRRECPSPRRGAAPPNWTLSVDREHDFPVAVSSLDFPVRLGGPV